MGTNTATGNWYTTVLNACFAPEDKISDVSFLKIFAAMCIPCNVNYGKAEKERASNTKAMPKRRPADEAWKDQNNLLDNYKKTLKDWQPDEDTIKRRVDDLAHKLITTNLTSEYDYAQKNSNYKAQNYLNLYLKADNPEFIFQKVANFYGSVLEKIFLGMPDLLKKQLQIAKDLFQSKVPDCSTVPDLVDSGQMGWYLSALLLLSCVSRRGSDEGHTLLCSLLGITPSESESTVSVLFVENITLKAHQFNTLCAAALRSDVELNELHTIFQILAWIRKKADNQLDIETRILVDQFMKAVKALGERKYEACSRNFPPSAEATREVAELSQLYSQCKDWLC